MTMRLAYAAFRVLSDRNVPLPSRREFGRIGAVLALWATSSSVFARQGCSDDPNFDDTAMMGTINLISLPGSTQACAYDATTSLHVTAKVSFDYTPYDGDCDGTPVHKNATVIEGDFVLCGVTQTDPLEECVATTALTWVCTDPTIAQSNDCEFASAGDLHLTATLNSTSGEVTWDLSHDLCEWSVIAPDCSEFEDLASTSTCSFKRCEAAPSNCITTPPSPWDAVSPCAWDLPIGANCFCIDSVECTLSIEVNGEVKEDELACDVDGNNTVNQEDLRAFIASRAPANVNELRDAVCCYNTFCTVLDLAQVYEVFYDEALIRFGRSVDADAEALTDSCLADYASQFDDMMGKEPNSGLGDGFGAGSDGNSGCGGGGGGADPSSGDPVDTARGYKREYATDLTVSAGGRGFAVSRMYTGQSD